MNREWWDAMKPLECHPDKVAAHNVAWATEELQNVNWVCNAAVPGRRNSTISAGRHRQGAARKAPRPRHTDEWPRVRRPIGAALHWARPPFRRFGCCVEPRDVASASHFDRQQKGPKQTCPACDRGWPLPSGPARTMSPWNFEDMLRDRQRLTFLQEAGLVVGRGLSRATRFVCNPKFFL